jgi:hypothetical protein
VDGERISPPVGLDKKELGDKRHGLPRISPGKEQLSGVGEARNHFM